MKAYSELSGYIAALNDLLNAMNILNWDARTQMPMGGNTARGHVLATLSGLAQEKLVSDDLQRLLERSEAETASLAEDSIISRNLKAVREASALFRRTPERLTREITEVRNEAQQRWGQARASSDFALFAPVLKRMVGWVRPKIRD